MALWDKKFDRINGETRVCMDCDIEFHTMKPINRCKKCIAEKYKHLQKPYERKPNYPHSTGGNGAGQKTHFNRIRKRCEDAWKEGRGAVTEHYDSVFKAIQSDGTWEWIWDRRDEESKSENRVKRDTKIKKDFPDTRNMSWDEYERGLGEKDVDS